MTIKETDKLPLPSDIRSWDEIDQSKAMFRTIPGTTQYPQNLGWYWNETKGAFYPHRKPYPDEIEKNIFFYKKY